MTHHHALLAALVALVTPAFAQFTISTPVLSSADNFRDVAGIAAVYGGTGHANSVAHNGVMRTGIFYRSNVLALSSTDLSTVSALRLARVIDLRTPSEISKTPDLLPTGVPSVNINILGPSATIPSLSSSAAAVAYMEGMNRDFVSNASQRAAFSQALLVLANTEGPVLFHCTGGKDRTGWLDMMLESIAGASSQTIMQDYLATSQYSAKSIASGIQALPSSVQAIYAPVFGVQPSFLQAGLDQVTTSYGTMDNYLTAGLGLTRQDIYVLRAKLVHYLTLPGQDKLTGNAAQGASLLCALQDSSLSGHYTNFNNYLQSSVDQGSLGGIELQVGGQIHADAVAGIVRLPAQLDDAILSETIAPSLAVGKNRIWLSGLFGYQQISARAGVSAASGHDQGLVLGLSRRLVEGFCGTLAFAKVDSTLSVALASAKTESYLLIAGGRLDLTGAVSGFYLDTQFQGALGNYSSERILGADLGTAQGDSSTKLFGARLLLGTHLSFCGLSLVPEAGVRVTHTTLGAFAETGSELPLSVSSLSAFQSLGVAKLGLEFGRLQASAWTISPSAFAAYERLLCSPVVVSEGKVLGNSISQESALGTRDLGRAGLELRAGTGAWSIAIGASALVGHGIGCSANTHFNAGYSF